ncbi:PREDICTED: immunoglobulin-like and fibronectin type III domain-containing protein 1 isoform X2 [Crocodylus porosus]|uniref:immunoglobulin-like and fibronectin type III domain-containing protein 1 isoform X2 n=1 Tax=Crocodylus porosus TaxID=8502 RepID=UPI00093ED98D|nr:PREDICTED: immunoglobulin-like and fibronectin type III domain-containing protein 1 isoform X2 [Crocodylus porosus]
MASHRPVKSVKKSSIPGVTIQQFVDNIPTGCCTPDFERKPITLTLQEGKNAIFRAAVKGVPVPEVIWKRNKGEMDNPDKYQTSFNAVTNEFILQINKLTAADADLYRCSVVNEYGEAFCVVGLRIIQAGFKKKTRPVPTETQENLKKELQDFRKLLRKRGPQAPRKKDIDMEQVWQLLLHADKKDYEKICLRYGIVDFRGMLRKLQQMKKDKEDKQAKYINSIRNLRHVKVNKEGNAMFDLEMDLKDPQTRIYLYKDGEMINYGLNDDNIKHCLKQVGKKYSFIINDLKPEDAGVYQLKVEDIDVFSTELEVDSIPVTFEHPLSEVCCSEKENAVFECSLCSPCYDAMWLHTNNPIDNNDKYEISVSSDGLNHKLMIKNVQPADKGTYTLDTGICSSSACLLVESARGKRRQVEGDETDKKGRQMDMLSDKESVKKLRQGEGPGDKDHFRDTVIDKDGLYGSGLDDSKGRYSSSMGADGRHGYLGQDGLAAGSRDGKMGTGQFSAVGIDGNLMENASNIGGFPGDEGGYMREIYGQESKLGDSDSSGRLAGEGVRASLYGKESKLGGAGIGGADLLGSLLDKDSMVGRSSAGGGGRLGGTGELSSLGERESMLEGVSAALGGSGGFSSPHGKDAMLGGVGAGGHAGFRGAEALGSLFGKDAALSGTSCGAGLGGSGLTGSSYDRGHILGVSGTGEGVGGAGSMGAFSSKDAMLGGASVGGGPAGPGRMGLLYGQDYRLGGPGAGAGSAGAAGMGIPHGKDAVLGGAHAGVTGSGLCGSEWSPGMEDSAIVGSVGTGGAGNSGAFSGKDSMLSGATAGGIGALSGRAGGGQFSVDGASAGCEHVVGAPYSKDSAKDRAVAGVTGGSGQGDVEGMGSLSSEGGIWSQAGSGLGGMGSLYGKDGVLGAGLGGSGVTGSSYDRGHMLGASGTGEGVGSGAGGLGVLQAEGGKVAGAMAGTGGASPVGDKTGMGLLQSGRGTVGGSRTAAGAGGAGGKGSLYSKDGLQGEVGFDAAGAAQGDLGGLGSLYGKDGMEYSAGAGAGARDGRGMGTLHSKDGVLGVMGAGSASGGGSGGIGSLYSRDSKLSKAGAAGVELRDMGGGGHLCGEDGLPGRTWTGAGAASAGFVGVGGLGSLHGQDALLGTTSAGVDGAGIRGMGSLYGKDGMLSGAGAGVGGAGGMGFLHGKDDVLDVSGVGGAGAAGVGSLYGKDGVLGAVATGVGVAGGMGSLYAQDGMSGRTGAHTGGAGKIGSHTGMASALSGTGENAGGGGVGGPEGTGSLYGQAGILVGPGVGMGDSRGLGTLDGRGAVLGGVGAGVGGVRTAAGKGPLADKDAVLTASGAGAGLGGEEALGLLRNKDAILKGAGAGAGLSDAQGLESLSGRDAMLRRARGSAGDGLGGAGNLGAVPGQGGRGGADGRSGGAGGLGSVYGKDDMLGSTNALTQEGLSGDWGMGTLDSRGSAVGGAGAGMGGASGLDSLHGRGSGLGGVGPGSEFRGAGGMDSFDGRDTFLGVAGAKGGNSGLGGSGSSYERDSAFSGTHVDAGGRLFNEVTDGRKSGVPDEGWQGYEPMSGLHSGAFSGDRRRQVYGLDASGLSADENLGSRDRKGREGRFPQDDVREPRCHFNKRLSDVHALKRKPAELCCSLNNEQMEGTWFKDGFKLTGMDGVSFKKEGPNHRLIIDKVDDVHAGTYRFEAEGIKTEAKVFVEDPPNVDKDLQEKLMKDPLVIKAGQSAVVKIPFEGRKPVKATWLKDGCELLDDARIHTDKTDNFTRLSISSTNRKDCGDYKVKLSNGSGALEVNLKLVVTDRPQPPMGPIEVVDSSITGITIKWKPPKDDGGKPVLSYAIERQQVGRQTWLTVGEADGSSTTFTANKVEHDKSYCFRVRAINAEGTSEPLESGEVMAATKVFPGPPAPPKIVETSKEAIKLSWAVPDKTGNSRILGYVVEKRKKGSSTWVPVTDQPITERKWKVTDLKEGLQYEFRVTAINAAGTGEASAPSESVFAQDPMDPPGHVRDLKVTNADYTSIALAWTKPKPEDGGEVKGYIVEMRSSNNLKWTQCNTQPLRMTTYTVKGLEPKEMYFLRVRAVNDGGTGEAVALDTGIQAMPPIVTPKFLIDDTVKSFMIVKAGNFIRVHIPFEASPAPEVTWLKDGLSLPKKAITTTKRGHTQLVIPAAEFSDSGIYSILLQNELGKRESFSFQIQVTDIPESPGPIQLKENVPNTVTITWEPSPTEKRESNLYYMVIKCDSRNGHWQVVGDLIYTNKFTLTKVIPGREYYFRVVAKNYMGSSDPSETVQPWSVQKEKAEVKVQLPKYRGVNQNQPPRFLVQLKPHVVTTGFDCRMSCAVTGHPKPKVTWYKDGKNLSEDPTFFSKNDFGVCCLVILGVTRKDEGEYEVLASNELGCAISKTFLVVREPSF